MMNFRTVGYCFPYCFLEVFVGVNVGGLMRGDTDLMGTPIFDRLYHKLKVLLLLGCNYTMQFISYSSIKTH